MYRLLCAFAWLLWHVRWGIWGARTLPESSGAIALHFTKTLDAELGEHDEAEE